MHSVWEAVQGVTGARSGSENVCSILTSENNAMYGENQRPGRAGQDAAEWHAGCFHLSTPKDDAMDVEESVGF